MRCRRLLAAVALAASFGCNRRGVAHVEHDPNEQVQQLMREKVEAVHGKRLNDQSLETLSTLLPRLRVGMTHDELKLILTEKSSSDPKTGKHVGTVVVGRMPVWLRGEDGKPLLDENGEWRPDPDRWLYVLCLQDANLNVVFDKEDRVLSWSAVPLPQ